MNTIIATFATQNAAKAAEQDLRDAGFEAIGIERQAASDDVVGNRVPEDLPDDGGEYAGNAGDRLADAPMIGLAGVNSLTNSGTSVPMGVPIVAEGLNGQTETRLTLKTDEHVDRAIKIITGNGSTLATDAQQGMTSTLDEVANPAQARDRLK